MVSHLNEAAQRCIGWVVRDKEAHAFVADLDRSRTVHLGHAGVPPLYSKHSTQSGPESTELHSQYGTTLTKSSATADHSEGVREL